MMSVITQAAAASAYASRSAADDAAFEQNTSKEHGGQRLRIDLLLSKITLPHLPDDLPLVQQVPQLLALHDGEPAPVAGVLQRFGENGRSALSNGAGQGLLAVLAGAELAGLVGEIVDCDRDGPGRRR